MLPAFLFIGVLLTSMAVAAPSPSSLPLAIKHSDSGVKYLWELVQNGFLPNRIPDHPETEHFWRTFLQSELDPWLHRFYRGDVALRFASIFRVDGFLRLASFQPQVYRFTLRQRTLKDIAEALIVEFVSWRLRLEKVYEDARRIQHEMMTQSAQVWQEVRNAVHPQSALLPLLPEKTQETQGLQEGLGIRPVVLSQSTQVMHMEPEAEKEARRRRWGKTLSLFFSANDGSSKSAS
ncbi:uncharacterized protein UTRI_03317 [Ustilago trichophora]|uniref:Uncharacterized protein n=1 Tax=Ustilago trichophora TaxID=86804 RepID=A0A5C3E5Z6_9BASI|nr:uncharacterized protein UTRI_03317 [Ustilago trichophora]